MSDEAQVKELFCGINAAPAWLDGIILCAGSCEYIDVDDFEMASFQRVMASNFYGVVHACRAALPLLRAGHARNPAVSPEIIGICSMSCYVGFPRAEAYGSSKAAMRYFLESLRCDVQPEIQVTVVYPGFIDTPMTRRNDFPMPFMLPVSRAAGHIVESMSRNKRSISFPWQLQLLLKLAALLPGLWYGRIVKGLSRKKAAHS
jgi:NAD(P)-dependent dehydrogenase (short-subunit alcohol dehydrogenase family)